MGSQESIDLQDWIVAYKKMKVDYYYTSMSGNYSALLDYEMNLEDNLRTLAKHVACIQSCQEEGGKCSQSNKLDFFKTKEFLGDLYLCGKSIEPGKLKDCDSEEKPIESISYRVMANPSINFHIFATYWLMKVGEKLDRELDSHIYANRLRRCKNGELNNDALGSFEVYAYKYQKWRNDALDTIQRSLDAKQKTTVITLDVKNYYYSINPEFLQLDPWICGLVSSEHRGLHWLFVEILKAWNIQAAALFGRPGGIPVGLPVSGLLANLALRDFDQKVIATLHPLYYGRYVDDVIIACGANGLIHSKDEFFAKLNIVNNGTSYTFPSTLIHDQEFCFRKEKCKCITFEKEKGRVKLEVFKKQLNERTSEWRELPHLPPPKQMGICLLSITDGALEMSQHLRDADNITVMRSRFAFMLRDCEIYARTFPPKSWKDKLSAFLLAYADYFVTLENFFIFERYLKRVLSLGALAEAYEEVSIIIHQLNRVIGILCQKSYLEKSRCSIESSNGISSIIFDTYRKYIDTVIRGAFTQSNPHFDWDRLINCLKDTKPDDTEMKLKFAKHRKSFASEKNRFIDFYLHDLAVFPMKTLILRKELTPLIEYEFGEILYKLRPESTFSKIMKFRFDHHIETMSFKGLGKHSDKNEIEQFNQYLYFLTRPLNEYDMYFDLDELHPAAHTNHKEEEFSSEIFRKVLTTFRGYGRSETNGKDFQFEGQHFKIPLDSQKSNKINVAVACYSMQERELDLHLRGQEDPGLIGRYERFTNLVNRMLGSKNDINYVVFPELAIPIKWFSGAARKLQKKCINLISGIEYFCGEKNISNQVWACLEHSAFDYHSFAFLRQKKQFPAYEEFERIRNESTLLWDPAEAKGQAQNGESLSQWPPVIIHGRFFFSMLICAELMNIQSRSALRGKIDCLFVPEWNKDINSFNDLVNASALDLHAFVVQCNNNKYGDCRIRGPFKENYRRDIIKAKGGENDYFILGSFNCEELRDFQLSRYKMEPYKPLPIGYHMSSMRKNIYLKHKK
ncbi:MAG: RNA-directed DNA polymerase [Sphaerochaeta sp.]|nr:RNA-directed DNA polymerase [Sphaerochaeta sp.]